MRFENLHLGINRSLSAASDVMVWALCHLRPARNYGPEVFAQIGWTGLQREQTCRRGDIFVARGYQLGEPRGELATRRPGWKDAFRALLRLRPRLRPYAARILADRSAMGLDAFGPMSPWMSPLPSTT